MASTPIEVKGINTPVSFTVTGGGTPAIQINGGAEVTSGTIQPNDTIVMRLTSAASAGNSVTGQPVTGVVMGVFNPQRGHRRWLRISAIPLFHPGETQPYQVFATFNDFTERFAAMCVLEERA